MDPLQGGRVGVLCCSAYKSKLRMDPGKGTAATSRDSP